MLYFCPTPIGNLKDMTYRAVEVLRRADLIACEDTRHAATLLAAYEIHVPLVSFHEHNEAKRTEELLARVQQGEEVAVISDAGMPGISDPGMRLIRRAQEEGVPYTVLPGANAAITAVVASGWDATGFMYLGFLPGKQGERRALLERVKTHPGPLVIYEAPHRLQKTLETLLTVLGNRRVVLCREMTKIYETYHLGDLENFLANHEPRGEYVIVVHGAEAVEVTDAVLKEAAQALVADGERPSRAAQEVAKRYNVGKNRVYALLHGE